MVDGVSRFLSTLAILIGVGGSYFLYQENQTLREQIEQAKSSPNEGAVDYESAKQFNEDWNAQLTDALANFNQLAKDAIARSDADRDARNQDVTKTVKQLYTDRLDLVEASKQISALQSIVYTPKLSLAENRMRLAAGGDANYVVVTNEGASAAQIRSVSFMPKRNGQFETTKAETAAAADRLVDGESLVIEFSHNDNQSQKMGHHREYERTYLNAEKVIPRGDSVDVAVQIQNSDHLGWGWEGSLRIQYGDGKSLIVPSVRAVFVPSVSTGAI